MAGLSRQAEEIVSVIEKPLQYIRKNNWANIEKVLDIERTLAPSIDRLLEMLQDKRHLLDRMHAQADGFDSASKPEKKSRTDEVLRLIDELRNAPQADFKQVAKGLGESVQWLKGVGPVLAQRLVRLGINTVEDVLYALPREYEDRREIARIADLEEGSKTNVIATVAMCGKAGRYNRNFEAHLQDGSGTLVAKWFQGVKWIENKIKNGDRVLIYGEVRKWRTHKEIHHPDVTVLGPDEEIGGDILPVYHATEGITQNKLRNIAEQVVEKYAAHVPDPLPERMRKKLGLMKLDEAFRAVHLPQEDADIDALRAKISAGHRRLVFDEFLLLQIGLSLKRRGALKEPAWPVDTSGELARRVARSLPFKLTGAQGKVIRRVRDEVKSSHPMNLLLQGDVGSGKTLVALIGALFAVEDGYQSAIMAPTEILAEQHYRNFLKLLEPENIEVYLLLGKTKAREKKRIRKILSDGNPCIVVGTHAVLSEPVDFHKLAYAVVDEQHRFGVYQRMSLKAKGGERVPHTVVMTATPIPRTLAMTLYGDLDLAVLDEMPPGRTPVKTFVKTERGYAGVWKDVGRELQAGRQAFVVCPLVEESDKSELLDATNHAKYLAEEVFPEFKVGLVHGRMKSDEKENVMLDFAAGKVQLLVATTVVEVGIDVPGATVMVVEHAERFGLSQLHQLRGRVGRGDHPGKCYLVGRYPMSEDAKQRLKIMTSTTDGFKIAEEDLAIRGPGEFLGARQSGMPDFRVANVARDGQVLIEAKEEAIRLTEEDPNLSKPDHRMLKRTLNRLWKGRLALAGIG